MMGMIETLLKSKWFIFLLLLLPILLIILEGFQGGFAANPVEFVQLETGKYTLLILLIVLWISPLKVLFPQAKWLKILTRHRRMIGVTSFIYALLHFTIYLLDANTIETMLENFTRPFILSGSVAFLILLLLAITSTNWMVKKLGAKRWKNLHRLVYVATFLVFLHVIAKEKSNILLTLLYFIPLTLAEGYRFYHGYVVNKEKNVTLPNYL